MNKSVCKALAGWALLFHSMSNVFSQEWITTTAPFGNWPCIGASADGRVLVAGASLDSLYISQDSGVTWSSTGLPPAGGAGGAVSADGMKLIALATGQCAGCSTNFGGVYFSSDSGATWSTNRTGTTDWHALACSADGTKLVAASLNVIYTSTNAGLTWKPTSAPDGASSLVCSADGAVLVSTAAGSHPVLVSTNGGITWKTAALPVAHWNSVACSAAGNRIVAASDLNCYTNTCQGLIYTSTNSGADWFLTTAPTNLPWGRVVSSADGTKLAGTVGYPGSPPMGPIYVSTNSGDSWAATFSAEGSWSSLASSADGGELLAGVMLGGIYMAQSISIPVLSIERSSSSFKVSWIVPSTDFMLQQSLNVTTPNWTNVTVPRTLDNTNVRYEVSLPPASRATFYRLISSK